MVEYFGDALDVCLVTSNGWVQSYGSRCVKPPIIYGDITLGCGSSGGAPKRPPPD